MTSLVLVEAATRALPTLQKLRKLLDALGVAFRILPLEQVLAGRADGSSLVLSEHQFDTLCKAGAERNRSFLDVVSGSGSVLVYPFSGSASGVATLSAVTGARLSTAPMSSSGTTRYTVADSRETCGPFSGLCVENVRCEEDVALRVGIAEGAFHSTIVGDSGNLLTHFKLDRVNLFVASSSSVFDVEVEHLRNLNVSDCFSGLVPLLMYLRHGRVDRLQTSTLWASWIIDDPNLRPRHGFLDLRELAPYVRETGAAVSVAFIPWNYRRTSPEIVREFRSAWPLLSLCVHGCDHTDAEFATRTYEETLPLIQLATSRMEWFTRETSLGYDPVMVFPRGEFSKEAMKALRTSSMLAAVNTELIDSRSGFGVKGGELLRPAITSFGGFPLFMRRRAEEPTENFALDLMLGKPCLIVTHHQYFEPGLGPLRAVVESLNGLEPSMKWMSVGSGISSTYSMAGSRDSTLQVRLYSSRTTLELPFDKTLECSKDEGQSVGIRAYVNSVPVDVNDGSPIRFSVSRSGGGTVTIDVKSGVWPIDLEVRQGAMRRVRVAVRRYLTEVRDNYLDRYPAVSSLLASIKGTVSF